MDRITAAKVFVAIVERGSMAQASEALDMSRSMVSRYLSEMEDWAGARLLHRTTRKITLSDAGEKVLAECYKLKDIEKDVQFVSSSLNTEPQGALRIGTSQVFGEKILTDFVCGYLSRYPKVSIDIQISNHAVNLVEERVDLAIRITNQLDPNIIARKFGDLRSVICVSEAYLKQRGLPKDIEQLEQHNCINYSYFGNAVWNFNGTDGARSVKVSGNLTANDPAALLQASLLGVGISQQPRFATEPYLQNGDLIELFPELEPETLGIYGIYQSRKHMSRALRVFIDELADYMMNIAL
ncbi:LysR family transcriptional regulator [Pseudoteredinibacter isoporae]|uniref:DNA-binding transcriptional LysR family regulator n=1 Tax=Pseudoteredinibacter isoporae TaxID=570281 RepID=A0A7X0JUT3_9GAMM|nr:LysR family transcriptional regulator [Pseudoteredinibacter isoporae]MBB6521830.1 DNA-binding transcriptional LysR family regulator [Pseudoteredinibacter isoporae]NHO87375.1 LysR family transcriptional regulator [Pseudoteredinibacter isoporae]NIB23199.1 LysR family transcriptional regulator [Pseudoteredinibacter isoporae]